MNTTTGMPILRQFNILYNFQKFKLWLYYDLHFNFIYSFFCINGV